jgi:Do/DeqQ family serine protease
MNGSKNIVPAGRARTFVAVLILTLAIGGAAWHGLSADVAAGASPGVPVASATAAAGRDSYADVVKAVVPAVVTIRTEARARISPAQFDGDSFGRFFGEERTFRQRGLGSGVVVGEDGYILTNAHVIDGAQDIQVELSDGRTLMATVVGADEPSDLALLKLAATDLRPIAFGDSEAVQVGDVVLAVGNPLGVGQTVTMGIVSAKSRYTGAGDGSYEDFLQTDAPINHGNSGGALVNTKGELVGINTQMVSTSDGNIGIGFAIPANMARRVMKDLRDDGRVRRARLGVAVQPVTSDMATSLGLRRVAGAIVSSVSPDSPAERAGLRRGDVIESFDGHPVNDSNSLRNVVASAEPGSTATIGVIRNGSEKTLAVTLGEAPGSPVARRNGAPAAGDDTALGIAVAPLTSRLAEEIGAPRGLRGLIVQQVDPEGRAAGAGLAPGDIIEDVNGTAVTGVDGLRTVVRNAADKPLLLYVHRRSDGEWNGLFVTVKPPR